MLFLLKMAAPSSSVIFHGSQSPQLTSQSVNQGVMVVGSAGRSVVVRAMPPTAPSPVQTRRDVTGVQVLFVVFLGGGGGGGRGGFGLVLIRKWTLHTPVS